MSFFYTIFGFVFAKFLFTLIKPYLMTRYIEHISVDTSFFEPLKGRYTILKYKLAPCKITKKNSLTGIANFVLSFEFEGLPEKGLSGRDRGKNSLINSWAVIDEAKIFIAWLSTSTRAFIDLSNTGFAYSQSVGPWSHVEIDEFDQNQISNMFKLKTDLDEGIYTEIERPDLSSRRHEIAPLQIPSDVPKLTEKLYSLPENLREQFFDACLSYQFAFQNLVRVPSVSLVALVNSVEVMIRHEKPLKGDAMKKFRKFFKQNLQFLLPPEHRQFLNRIYGDRSNFVHQALLGSGPFRGPIYLGMGRDREIREQIEKFEILVNAGLISWLQGI